MDAHVEKKLSLSLSEKREVHDALFKALAEYCDLDNVSDLQLMLLTDVLIESMGKLYYNKGIRDARLYLANRLEDLGALEV